MQLKTPRLVRIESDYPAHISKRARYERKQVFDRSDFGHLGMDVPKLAYWMAVWERQIVDGRHPKWHRYTPEKFEAEGWTLYGNELGIHPILICDEYAYAGPPLYDKTRTPWMARFLWFHTIDALDSIVSWLDLGGGSNGTWRDLLRNPDKSYKWLYVQPDLRKEPAPPWRVQVCQCGWRQLIYEPTQCARCRRAS